MLEKFADKSEVIYEYQKAKFYFSKHSLIEYCEKKNFAERNNFIYKELIQYLKQDSNRIIIISDTLGLELVPDSTINFWSKSDTLIRVRDQKSNYAYVTEAINEALLDFAGRGQLRVYDKREQQFVDFIVIDKVEEKWYGETNIHLPNDSIVFSYLRWIK